MRSAWMSESLRDAEAAAGRAAVREVDLVAAHLQVGRLAVVGLGVGREQRRAGERDDGCPRPQPRRQQSAAIQAVSADELPKRACESRRTAAKPSSPLACHEHGQDERRSAPERCVEQAGAHEAERSRASRRRRAQRHATNADTISRAP
jgi:hypothetical protein